MTANNNKNRIIAGILAAIMIFGTTLQAAPSKSYAASAVKKITISSLPDRIWNKAKAIGDQCWGDDATRHSGNRSHYRRRKNRQ